MDCLNDYALIVKGLSFSIDEIDILKDIGLNIKKGEFVGLIGPNGAGKTTLLKCINGINKGEGTLAIKGVSLSQLSNIKIAREISLMHQNTSITFQFPALDVVLMGRYPHLKRMTGESSEDYRIARKYMDYTGTAQFEERPISSISGGERQRVLFAKVLTQETDLVLLDEPTASLDITHQEQIFEYSRELCAAGKTVIAAVHDLKIASRYCSRLILMKEGRVIADGRPEEVMTSKNLFKAYGVNAFVFKNRVTGQMDFYIHHFEGEQKKGHVHVIGGGSSASGIIRQLFNNGYRITAGVFMPGDTDLQCAEVFGIEHVISKPFSDICDESYEANVKKIRDADTTVLCNILFGGQNIRNLEAARFAKTLVIIEDDAPEVRDFTEGKAVELYNELRHKATVTTSARLHEVI